VRTFSSPEELAAVLGETIATSDWLLVDQARIDLFAEATGDHQWIHVDPERAATGPFGGTIAHGYLTLSLLPQLAWSAWKVEGVTMGVNAGLNRVRLLNPVRSGARVRSTSRLLSAEPAAGGWKLVIEQTVEIEGEDKPACVAETVTRLFV
jgi:acyl dehydratase